MRILYKIKVYIHRVFFIFKNINTKFVNLFDILIRQNGYGIW